MAKPAWIDITMELGHPAGTWPGDAPTEHGWTARLGDAGPMGVNLAWFRSSPHNGTHSDAPFHVLRGGAKSESLDASAYMGSCRVVDFSDEGGDEIPIGVLERATKGGPKRVLFKQRKGALPSKFPKKFRGVADDLAAALVDAGVLLVGTDAPSIESFLRPGLLTHRALLGRGVHIIENLVLDAVGEGDYELAALPMKIQGLCAAPVRALLRRA